MCESWIYGCGHAIRTPCPRPKPVSTLANATTTTTTNTSASGSVSSNPSTSTHSSPRRYFSNTNPSSTSTPPISKFCNGFPVTPKETASPCYHCILADARLKIALEKPEVDAKKEQLRHGSMGPTMARDPDGSCVDQFGNKVVAAAAEEEEGGDEYALERGPAAGCGYGRQPGHGQGQGQGRDRSFTTGQVNVNSNGRFGRNGYMRGEHSSQDRRNSTAAAGGPHGEGLRDTFAHHRDGYYNGNGNGSTSTSGGQFQPEQSQLHGGGSSNEFGAHHGPYGSYGYPTGYHQHQHPPHVTTDFGGASWGQHSGLGSGLDASMYHHHQQHHHQHVGHYPHFDGPRF